jgi:hypothetical protein
MCLWAWRRPPRDKPIRFPPGRSVPEEPLNALNNRVASGSVARSRPHRRFDDGALCSLRMCSGQRRQARARIDGLCPRTAREWIKEHPRLRAMDRSVTETAE